MIRWAYQNRAVTGLDYCLGGGVCDNYRKSGDQRVLGDWNFPIFMAPGIPVMFPCPHHHDQLKTTLYNNNNLYTSCLPEAATAIWKKLVSK